MDWICLKLELLTFHWSRIYLSIYLSRATPDR
jgi:hypothetical protein